MILNINLSKMNWLIKLIAIATYKGKIQKHSLILSIVHIFNPISNAILVLLYSLFFTKINVPVFLALSLIFHAMITYLLYRNYNILIKGIDKSTLMKISNFRKDMFRLGYVILVIICILFAIIITGYGSVIIDKIHR